jgi:hypothetical protein
MDPAIGALVGLVGAVVGALLTTLTIRLQTKHLEVQRREDRRFEQLMLASRYLRESLLGAVEMDYSRSWRASTFDLKVWGPRWERMAETLAQASSAMAIVRPELDRAKLDRFEAAIRVLGDARGSKRDVVDEYVERRRRFVATLTSWPGRSPTRRRSRRGCG